MADTNNKLYGKLSNDKYKSVVDTVFPRPPERGIPTYYIAILKLKTAWNWKNLDRMGALRTAGYPPQQIQINRVNTSLFLYKFLSFQNNTAWQGNIYVVCGIRRIKKMWTTD